MFKNYIKTALRNFKRNKSYTVINTAGLSVGIAACLLLFLVIQFQTSFDNFHAKRNSIYRVGTAFHNADGIDYSDGISFPVAKALRIDFPQIKEVAAIYRTDGQITIENANAQQKKLVENNFFYAEPEFFKMFDFPFIKGNAVASLRNRIMRYLHNQQQKNFSEIGSPQLARHSNSIIKICLQLRAF